MEQNENVKEKKNIKEKNNTNMEIFKYDKHYKKYKFTVTDVLYGSTGSCDVAISMKNWLYKYYIVSFYCDDGTEKAEWLDFFRRKIRMKESVKIIVHKSGRAYSSHNSNLLRE